MSSPQQSSAATLPAVLSDVSALTFAGAIDTTPLRSQAHRFDLNDLDRLVITGRDRQRFLHAMLSNDVANLEPGQGCWATLNTIQGRTVTDLRLFQVDPDRRNGQILGLLEPGASPRLIENLDKYLIAEKVYFEEDTGSSLSLIAGQGAEEALKGAGANLPEPGALRHCMTEINGSPLRLIRLDRSGEQANDLLLWSRKEDKGKLDEALAHIPVGERSLLEAARIEGAHPRFGADLSEKNIPLEAGLGERAIHFSKGCYIGQEVICRIDSMGAPARRLVQLLAKGRKDVPPPGAELFAGKKAVGTITSAFLSTAMGGVVALGYVKKRFIAPGTELRVDAVATDEKESLLMTLLRWSGPIEGPEAQV